MAWKFEQCRASYARMWRDMQIRPSRLGTVRASAGRILRNKARYEAVERATGVPWYFVGIAHKMECPKFPEFVEHLHNGDSLAKRTWRVPAGRPLKGSPPFTWEASAIDALQLKGLHRVRAWSLERIAFELERFNGFGYRNRGVPSPYLWSFTPYYVSGKFVRDHQYDATAVSTQSGAMALLKVLAELDPTIELHIGDAPDEPDADESERLPQTPSVAGSLARSRTLLGTVVAFFGWLITQAQGLVSGVADGLGEVAEVAGGLLGPAEQIAGYLGVTLAGIGTVAVLYGLVIVLGARVIAQFKEKVA